MTASISDDVRVLSEALADSDNYAKAMRNGNSGWAFSIEQKYEADGYPPDLASMKILAQDPARLRRVLDAMQALAGALRELNRQRIERVDPLSVAAGMAWSKAVAALALYEGKQ